MFPTTAGRLSRFRQLGRLRLGGFRTPAPLFKHGYVLSRMWTSHRDFLSSDSATVGRNYNSQEEADKWSSSKLRQRRTSVHRDSHPPNFTEMYTKDNSATDNPNEKLMELNVTSSDLARPYAIFSTLRLARGLIVTQLCSYRFIIENAQSMLDVSYRILGKKITNHALRVTVFAHFCAGETHAEVEQLLKKLSGRGMGGILDYAAEASECDVARADESVRQPEEDAYYESNVAFLRKSVISAGSSSQVGFSALKVTSLVSSGFLRRLSTVLKSPDNAASHLDDACTIEPMLHPEDVQILADVTRRLDTIIIEAAAHGSRVMVDAEDTTIQPAIDFLTIQSIKKRNTYTPVVYQTYQMYLKKSIDRLKDDKHHIEASGAVFACKLVRGAYMESERQLAAEAGVESPVHDTIEDTHKSYEQGLTEMMKTAATSSVMVASHNEKSAEFVNTKLEELIKSDANEVFFAQLLGMKDALSVSLVNKGCKVYKYLPYGPIEEVIPYLLRRSQENSQMAEADPQSRDALIEELWGRFRGNRTHELGSR